MLLRDSQFKGELTYEEVIALAESAANKDENGYQGNLSVWLKLVLCLEHKETGFFGKTRFPIVSNIQYSFNWQNIKNILH